MFLEVRGAFPSRLHEPGKDPWPLLASFSSVKWDNTAALSEQGEAWHMAGALPSSC